MKLFSNALIDNITCLYRLQDRSQWRMSDGAVGAQQQQVRPSVSMNENDQDSKPPVDHDAPLDFSIRRDHVTPLTSSQAAVTSPPVAAPPPPVLFPQLVDPALVSALSAAGLLLRPPTTSATPATTPPSPVGDVTDRVRAYVQSKIAEEQRRLTRTTSSSSSSSPSVDSSVERTASPVRSSPTSTTTPTVGFDAMSPRWPPPTVVPPPPPVSEQSPAVGATGSRKRGSSCTDTSTTTTSKDTHYWERRRKNNEAAKRSRDARRAKEEEVAVRASMLEQENRQLRVELTAFRLEVARLSELLCRQVAQRSTAPTGPTGTPQDNKSPR